jgi:hypothetical protein
VAKAGPIETGSGSGRRSTTILTEDRHGLLDGG